MMPVDTIGRELIELVQIDQDFCNNTFGVAPCTATTGDPSTKCFNTYATCQDQPNYDKGTKQITFKKNQAGDVEEYTIPILKSFSVTLPELNIFSRDTKNQELGKFGKCTASFSDTIFSDNHLDPYVSERNYNPLEQGTFWTKFLARNPYYEGWKIRLYDGEVGQTLAEMNVREYELEKITNPDTNGNVTIKATDPMRKLDKSKAYFPPISNCILAEDFLIGQNQIKTLGKLTEYTGFSKYLSIEGDSFPITSFVDNGDGTYTYNLGDISSEDYFAGYSVVNAVLFSDSISSILNALLEQVYTVDEFDYIGMQDEISNYMLIYYGNLTRFLSEPVAINELLASLEQECGFYIWYDDIDKIIKFKAVRDEQSTVEFIDQNKNLVSGKTSSKTVSEDRFTESYIFYDKGITILDRPYKQILLTTDLEASGANKYNSVTTYELKTKWLIQDQSAQQTASNLEIMFNSETKTIEFELDIKNDLRMAQVFKLAWRGYTDIYGNDEVINWICTGRTRTRDRLKITAQEFKFNVPEV